LRRSRVLASRHPMCPPKKMPVPCFLLKSFLRGEIRSAEAGEPDALFTSGKSLL
jgi:hypothetical protein